MVDQRTGMVTLLFTDIESSTDRWEDDSEAMAASLAAHDAVLDAAIERCGGRRFKHTGDGVCAVFAAPSSAVRAALDAQAEVELPVRMAVHTGEAEAREGDYFGPTLNRCARIMDAGHGGQVLVSSATAGLVEGIELVELGAYALKGIERS
jgi:class 3 adenylate cyclase